MKHLFVSLLMALMVWPMQVNATRLLELKVLDKDYLIVHLRDGEVHYRDNGTGPSAFRGHDFAEGDDTLVVFGKALDAKIAAMLSSWTIYSPTDKTYINGLQPVAVHRKAKPMNTDHTLTSLNDHWVYLKLPSSMKAGCKYQVKLSKDLNAEGESCEVVFDINQCMSEAVHVNIIGYVPSAPVKAADLYLWMGDGGQRDYSSFIGKKVYLYNVKTGKRKQVGKVDFWKKASDFNLEANKKNMTGSDVWNIDFKESVPGRYRLVVEDVGCSMDFDIKNDVYYTPYAYSIRGYYYMRLGEAPRPDITPIPRQPLFIPEVDPKGFTVYITDLHPWHPEWRKLRGDVWDEPHFKPALESIFWKHRVAGNKTNTIVRGGHSDAFDWDRHIAHVSNIYDMLLPYFLTNGALPEDNVGIAESGNGIPDIIDEARNEVDFFLSIRDGEGYSQGITNPSVEHTIMYQAGCTTMAAWANAANCAMIADCFRIAQNDSLKEYYTAEAIKAFNYANKQADLQLDERQGIGNETMFGRDFKQMAAAFLYNVTGDKQWEDILAAESMVKKDDSPIFTQHDGYQIWGTAAYLHCPHERHYPELYQRMKKAVTAQAYSNNVNHMEKRPSRRTANDPRWQTSENMQLVMIAHSISNNKAERQLFEKSMWIEADWGLGRNPSNTVEMTGLGERHITDCYTTGRNDGTPESHPGQTPFNGTETWSPGHNGGDARVILAYCYPAWDTNIWPSQESFFNQRYFWVNGEFTPRETMRGKMALLGYLNALTK
ncbi:MAG: glycosyl hydrolase family 5 [Bacteroidaceae bacterium]|nr:glycosyl hydrolase family 5 [Bacteroidaceae bacterium]